MIRFQLLGPLDLLREDGRRVDSVLTQPKRLALLAYLALARPRGLRRRDTLLALFWPELGENAARGALRQALFFLRSSLGREVLRRRGAAEVGIDRAHLRTDVEEVEEALGRRGPSPDGGADVDAALQRVATRPFMDGFHVSGVPAFEEWVEGERTRIRQLARETAERRGAEAASAGDLATALRCARAALRLDPLDDRAARRLILVTLERGDRAGALAAWAEFESRYRRELEEDPPFDFTSIEASAVVSADRADEGSAAAPATAAGAPESSAASGPRRGLAALLGALPLLAVLVTAGLLGYAAFGPTQPDAPLALSLEPPAALGEIESPVRILWVDDNPDYNTAERARLEAGGIGAAIALTTEQAVQRFDSAAFPLVISDMGRYEGPEYRPRAGLELLHRLRARDQGVRVIFYTSPRAAESLGEEADEGGAVGIAGSEEELFRLLWSALRAGGVPWPSFEPVQPDLFEAGGALANAWADHDGDGDLDLFVGFNGAPNRLYLNDGGAFRDGAASAGLAHARPARAAAWGDYDDDGDPDLLVGFAPGAGSVLRLYRNDGGGFVDVTTGVGLEVDSGAVRQPAWIDVEGDGDLDLFVAFRDRANALFRNEGGRFADVAPQLGLADGRRSVGAVWLDYDEDGDLDVVVGNMDGDANGLFRNDEGRFTDVAEEAGIAWGGRAPGEAGNGTVRPCAADVDGDGRLDLFFANYGPNGLFLSRGGRFEDVSRAWGVAIDGRYDTCAFADVDHDGRLDLYVNGTITGGVAYPDYLFRNAGAAFEDETPANIRELAASHGARWADFDDDGDPDLALAGAAAGARHPLLRNLLERGPAARSLRVDVRDERGRALPGAEVRVYHAGTRTLLGTRLVDTGSGYNGQSVQPVHFGVGDAATVEVEVVAPGGGARRVARMEGVAVSASEPTIVTVRVEVR